MNINCNNLQGHCELTLYFAPDSALVITFQLTNNTEFTEALKLIHRELTSFKGETYL